MEEVILNVSSQGGQEDLIEGQENYPGNTQRKGRGEKYSGKFMSIHLNYWIIR
jgi:hypothetical protein